MDLKRLKEKLAACKKYSKRGRKYIALLKTRNVIISLSLLFISLIVFSFICIFDRNEPYVFSITPEVAMPDEQLTIRGLFFGPEKGTSSVYISDIKVPGSAYEKWSRFEIVIRIPEEVSFGVVRVRNSYGFSNGKLFTGQKAIPRVEQGAGLPNGVPSVTETEPENPVPGETFVLRGVSFGGRGVVERLIVSSSSYEKQSVIGAYDTEKWEDTEIRCRMPDGFYDGGTVTVVTRYGESQPFEFKPHDGVVGMHFADEGKMQAELSVSAAYRGGGSADAVIVLPSPVSSYRQYPVAVKGGNPRIVDGREFRFFETDLESKEEKVAAVEMKVRLKSVAFEPVRDCFFSDCGGKATVNRLPAIFAPAAGKFVSGRVSLVDFVDELKNIFDTGFRFSGTAESDTGTDEAEKAASGEQPNEAAEKPFAESRTGDAFDFAFLYADVLRKSGVEARVVTGYYLPEEGGAVPHAWIEYRYPGFGFIPKDPTAGRNGFRDTFVENAPAAGGISFRYLEIFNRNEKLPARLYEGRFIKAEEGVFAGQDFYAELNVPEEEVTVGYPVMTHVKFR